MAKILEAAAAIAIAVLFIIWSVVIILRTPVEVDGKRLAAYEIQSIQAADDGWLLSTECGSEITVPSRYRNEIVRLRHALCRGHRVAIETIDGVFVGIMYAGDLKQAEGCEVREETLRGRISAAMEERGEDD